MFNIPIVLFVFNRPQCTQNVLEVIRQVRPSQLFVIADGPRLNVAEDIETCQQVKNIIETSIDWPCQLHQNYSPVNLGAGARIASGITWVFDQAEAAIFLEDDCVPSPTFFPFCAELLATYRDQLQVTQICGTNILNTWKSDKQSYHFAYYGSAWGWASWRRAWQFYDHHIFQYDNPQVLNFIAALINEPEEFEYFQKVCTFARQNPNHFWDYQWSFAQLAQAGLSIIPSKNLVHNIGIDETGTNTKNWMTRDLLDVHEATFPLIPPAILEVDRDYNHEHYLRCLGKPSLECGLSMIQTLLRKKRTIQALLICRKLLLDYPQHPQLMDYQAVALAELKQ